MSNYYSGNRFLSYDEMKTNAVFIRDYLLNRGWTLNAICGMLGNMQTESTLNPGIWQDLDAGNTSMGYGLVQWTPATKYIDWCNSKGLDPSKMESALQRIEYELENGLQYYPTESYNLSFAQFKVSKANPYYLGMAFLLNYERPLNQNQSKRGEQAKAWYEYLSNVKTTAYTPRLTSDGMEGNAWYYSKNPFYQSGYGLPNCTCYAWGRWGELLGEAPTGLSLGNADSWIDRSSGYEVGTTPRLGAILVSSYDGGGDGGHVAVVEQINEDGSIVTSNSAWGGAYFYTETLYPPYEFASWVNFLGFLYPPVSFGGIIYDDETGNKKKRKGLSLAMMLLASRRL